MTRYVKKNFHFLRRAPLILQNLPNNFPMPVAHQSRCSKTDIGLFKGAGELSSEKREETYLIRRK